MLRWMGLSTVVEYEVALVLAKDFKGHSWPHGVLTPRKSSCSNAVTWIVRYDKYYGRLCILCNKFRSLRLRGVLHCKGRLEKAERTRDKWVGGLVQVDLGNWWEVWQDYYADNAIFAPTFCIARVYLWFSKTVDIEMSAEIVAKVFGNLFRAFTTVGDCERSVQ